MIKKIGYPDAQFLSFVITDFHTQLIPHVHVTFLSKVSYFSCVAFFSCFVVVLSGALS